MARNARNQGGVSDKGTGEPGTKDAQASVTPGQTPPNARGTQEPSVIEPGTKYVINPNKPTEVFTGEQVLALAMRGALLDQTQSKLQKAQGLLGERDKQLADKAKQLSDAQARIDDVDSVERIKEHLKEIIPGFGKDQTPPAGDFNWPGDLTGGENPIAGITPEKLTQALKRMSDETTSKAVAKAQEVAKAEATSVLNTKSTELEQQRRADEFVGREFRSSVARLEAGLPDVSQQQVQDIAKLRTAAGALEMEARDRVSQGENEAADKLWSQAQEDRDLAFQMHDKLVEQQKQIADDRERTEQIEMISSGGPVEKQIKYADGPTHNKAEARKRAEERLAQARELEAEMQKYKSP